MTPEFWSACARMLNLLSVAGTLFLLSKVYRNVVEAHKRHIYTTVEYNDCVIEKEAKR